MASLDVKTLTGRVGPVELHGLIGVGGMGAVHRARLIDSGEDCAIKLVSATRSSADRLARFEREARLGRQLKHPSLIRVDDYGEDRDCRFMVMELLDGSDLKKRLTSLGPLPWQDVVKYALSMSTALELCHSQGVIHRDVKPSNALIGLDGSARLADFGLAIIHGEGAHREENQGADMRVLVGTPAYMAPEQFSRPNGVDARADLYSLGMMIYELIAGERPFDGHDVPTLRRQHERVVPESLCSIKPGVPGAVEDIVDRLLRKKPRWRYATAADLSSDLRRALRGQPPLGSAERGRLSPAPRREEAVDQRRSVDGRPGKRWTWVAFGLTVLLLLAIPTYYLVVRRRRLEKRAKMLCQDAVFALSAGKYRVSEGYYREALDIDSDCEQARLGLKSVAAARIRAAEGKKRDRASH
jgi:serine/threonine protein kinase